MKIFSGIQPTGAKHLGNLIGGFRQYAATQEQGEAYFCIVDLHSITVDYDPADLRTRTFDLAAMLFATGLDADRSTVFCQSHVTAHPEAAWLLSAATSYGQLGRMTQFKDKGDRQEFVSAGLFTYPVLMAGDILLYQTDIVPIGDDQRQHLELARDIAERFNARFGETFVVPRGVYPEVGATDHGPPGADAEDVDDRRYRAGHGAAAGRARRAPEEVQDGGHRLGPRGAAGRGQAWDHEPDRHHVRRRPARRPTRSSGSSRMRGYGDFKQAVGEAVVELLRADPGAVRGSARRRGGAPPAARDRSRQGARRVVADARGDVRADGIRQKLTRS